MASKLPYKLCLSIIISYLKLLVFVYLEHLDNITLADNVSVTYRLIIMLDLSFVICSEKDAPFINWGSIFIVLMKCEYIGIIYMGILIMIIRRN